MYRYKFWELFQQNSDGSLSPKFIIRINGITFGPGVSFSQGVSFGGVNLFQFIGLDIAVEKNPDGAFEVKGFYKL